VLRGWLGSKPNLSDARPAGQSLPLQARDAFAGVVPLRGLKAATTYYYDLRLDKAPPPVQPGYSSFTTFPKPGVAQDFSFAFGSCFRPAQEGGGIIFQSLEAQRLSLEGSPGRKLRFVLMIGDQIYPDDWEFNGLSQFHQGVKKGAQTLEDYRNVYLHTWRNEHLRRLLRNLPVFMTLDDHEVDDDWHWSDAERRSAGLSTWARLIRWLKGRPPEERRLTPQRVRDALQAYWEHQGMHGPPLLHRPQLGEDGGYLFERHHPGSLAYAFAYGTAAFFVLDTRTMRVWNSRERRMLGDGQWHLLKEWLLQVRDEYPLKFIVTSSSVLYSMFGDFLGDRWSGFRGERDTLLRFIGEQRVQNVYVIAGDLHSSHSMTAECGDEADPILLHEFCSTPFEQVCNRYARWLYTSIKTGAVQHPKRQFVVTEPNYGIVRVHYGKGGRPKVDFTLYGTQGQRLAPEPSSPG
jgi:alkaline phosphatase D